MNKSIRNMKELELELQNLKLKRVQLETGIRNDISSIKEGLRPMRIAGRIVSGFITKQAGHDDIIARGLGFGAEMLSKRYMAGFPPILRKILSKAVENVTVNLASKKTTPIAAYLSDFVRNLFHKSSDDLSPESRVTVPSEKEL